MITATVALSLIATGFISSLGLGAPWPIDTQPGSPPHTRQGEKLAFGALLKKARTQTQARDWKAAAGTWSEVVEKNPVNDHFWNHLAYALFLSQRFEESIAAYQRVFELRGQSDYFAAYGIACAHARLDQPERALDWLERSLAVGLPEFQVALEDPDLVTLRELPRFRKLMALIERESLSREVGWAHDLRLLQREVKRIGYDPFSVMSKRDFDEQVAGIIRKIPQLDDSQIKIECMKLMRKVGDGHSGFYARFETVPLKFYWFAEGLFIVAADPAHRELLGSEVLKFGEKTIPDVLAEIAKVQSRDNEHWLLEIGPHKMRSPGLLQALELTPRPDRYALTLRSQNGETRTVTVTQEPGLGRIWNGIPDSWITFNGTPDHPLPLYRQKPRKNFWFEKLADESVLYCQINRVRDEADESFATFCQRLFAAFDSSPSARVVLDMRRNKGGNTSLAAPLLAGIQQRPALNQRGQLYVVIGRRTFSAAQNLATMIETRTAAIFAGEPSGSSPNFIGEENTIQLPYSRVTMSVSNVRWVHASPFDRRTCIAPEIYAPPTFQDFRANRDPVMREVLAFIRSSS